MDKNELKKLLYKERVAAVLLYIKKGNMLYKSTWELEEGTLMITFLVPLSEIGDATFHSMMEAKHLIRWLQD